LLGRASVKPNIMFDLPQRRPTAKARKLAAEALQARAVSKATDLAPIIAELQAAGVTSRTAIAAGLTERGIPTPRGKGQWSTTQVSRLLERL